MVKRLSFKGDKPKKKKSKLNSTESAEKKRLAEEGDVSGWVSAKSSEEFNGPTLLATISDGKPCCFAFKDDDKPRVVVSYDIDTVDASLNTAEPTTSSQVLLFSPLDFDSNKRTKDIDETTANFALKVPSLGVYVGIDKDDKTSLSSVAIGNDEHFTFKRVDGLWTMQTARKRYILVKDGKITTTENDETASKFAVRLQTSHRKKTTAEKQTVTYFAMGTKALEERAGRQLDRREVETLQKANKEGNLNEALLDLRQKGKSDTYC